MECLISCPCTTDQLWWLRDLQVCAHCGVKCPFCMGITAQTGACGRCKSKSRDSLYCNKCYTCPTCRSDLQPSVKTLTDASGTTCGKMVKFRCHKCGFKYNTEVLNTPRPLGEFVWDMTRTKDYQRFEDLATAMDAVIEGKRAPIGVLQLETTYASEVSKPVSKRLSFTQTTQCLRCLEDTKKASAMIPRLLVQNNCLEFLNEADHVVQLHIGQMDGCDIPAEIVTVPVKGSKQIPLGQTAPEKLDVVVEGVKNLVRYKIVV